MQPINVITLFSGYDSQCMALDRLGIPYDLIAWSEIDKAAIAAHNTIYPQYADRNLGDVSKIDWGVVTQPIDLLTYSSPCQDFSQAGLQRGGDAGSGTRSSLLWECERAISALHPKYLLLENVAALVSEKFMPLFQRWLVTLQGYGYNNYFQVLNAKDYGVPQNRERVFCLSKLESADSTPYYFPKPFKLKKRLKDVLEQDVAERYYLSEERVQGLLASTAKEHGRGNGFGFSPLSGDEEAAGTIKTTNGHRKTDNFIAEPQVEQSIISPGHGYFEGRESDDTAPTVKCSAMQAQHFVKEATMRVRRLTERELYRLMDLEEHDIDTLLASDISHTQHAKLAGNSIVVACLEHIFHRLFIDPEPKHGEQMLLFQHQHTMTTDNTLPTFINEEEPREKKRDGRENLIPTTQRSKDEVREMQRKGGINSGASRRRAKSMREAAKIFGEMETIDPQNEFQGLTNDEVLVLQQYRKAVKDGNTKSAEFLAKLKGEEVQRVEMTATVSAMVQARQADPYAYLYRPFSLTYQQFFYDNRDSRHVLLQGGRRSGKTQATIRHLLRLCAASGGENKIMVVCYQHPQLLKTIEDFVQITGIEPKADKATTEGALWHFCNFDEYTKAQGSQCDYLFINEAVNMTEDIADTLVLGTRKQCFYNYNPTKSSWVSKLVAPDGHNLLCTTFKDNDYLPAEQIAEFERMRERALLPTASMHDRYVYEVYYKGNFAQMVGQVFGRIERCTLDEYQQLQCGEVYGMDFGFATDGDPTVLVGVKIADNKIYVRQIIYEQGLTSNEVLTRRMQQAGLNQYCDIRADYGGMGKGRIADLRRLNWSIQPCYKTAVLDGISQMLCYDGVVIVEGGDETLAEFEGYELTEGGKIKGDDHAIDATRYAFIVCKLSV